jgi:hypothetical protein
MALIDNIKDDLKDNKKVKIKEGKLDVTDANTLKWISDTRSSILAGVDSVSDKKDGLDEMAKNFPMGEDLVGVTGAGSH